MLQKPNRLSKDREIKKTLALGRGFFNPLFTLRVLFKTRPDCRITVIVSTKTAKRSYERNRIKRILREHLRRNLNQLKPGDYVLIVKKPASALINPLLRRAVSEFLAKNKLILGLLKHYDSYKKNLGNALGPVN